MPYFEVTLTRAATQRTTITVHADTLAAAREKAITQTPHAENWETTEVPDSRTVESARLEPDTGDRW